MPDPTPEMPPLDPDALQDYLGQVLGQEVRITGLAPLGEPAQTSRIKSYGYGHAIRIEYETGGQPRRAVLHTISPGQFGHERMTDRARALLEDYQDFNRLPRHVHALDVGGFRQWGGMKSVGDVDEFFLLTDFVEGCEYAHDLMRLQDHPTLTDLDLRRADALCDYLLQIHATPGPDPGLYTRRIRELIGSGECIMGLIDAYPRQHEFITPAILETLEHLAVAWRWKLKDRTHRLRQVHGDFHPWNILFQDETGFHVLDRSRGAWGEPADDITSLTINYLFFSLNATGRLEGPWETLFHRFWNRYLEKSGDTELLEVAPPFLAFRGLVLASPVWYPNLTDTVRRKLFGFIQTVLENGVLELENVNASCEG